MYYALHEHELADKGNIFADNVEANIYMSKQIFGNEALLLLLSHRECATIEELVRRTFDLKFKIRQQYRTTRDGRMTIAINASLANLSLQKHTVPGELVVKTKDGCQQFSEHMKETGIYMPAQFNYIHCSEVNMDDFYLEYEIMSDGPQKVLTLNNKMSMREYNNCVAMHSCRRNRGL